MNKEEDEPVRWMACVYAKDIIMHASEILVLESYKNADPRRAEEIADQMEASLKKLKWNLQDKPATCS